MRPGLPSARESASRATGVFPETAGQIQGASQAECEFSDIQLRTKLLERQRPWATAPRPVAEAFDKSEGDCASCALPSPAFQKAPEK